MLYSGAQRFFYKDVHVGIGMFVCVKQDLIVRKIGGSDDCKIAEIGLKELLGGGECFDGCKGGRAFGLKLRETESQRVWVIISNASDEDVV